MHIGVYSHRKVQFRHNKEHRNSIDYLAKILDGDYLDTEKNKKTSSVTMLPRFFNIPAAFYLFLNNFESATVSVYFRESEIT